MRRLVASFCRGHPQRNASQLQQLSGVFRSRASTALHRGAYIPKHLRGVLPDAAYYCAQDSGKMPPMNEERKATMKKNILLTLAAAGIFSLATSANAGEPLMSPRAKAQADSLRKVAAVRSDVSLATNRPPGNVKAWELTRSFRRFPSPGTSVNLAHAPRPLLSPKDPRFEGAWRANAAAQSFHVAPVK
jgi:hypothetical protein